MLRKSIIIRIKGTKLTKDEKDILIKYHPWGVILFSRNINNINQVKKLTKKIRNIMHDKYYPILIDQEGGRVSRLNKIMNFNLFPQSYFGSLFRNKNFFYKIKHELYVDKVSQILNILGININIAPVLDLRYPKGHKIIGNRSFSNNARQVSILGNRTIELFKKNKIGNVVKHIPGHGLSNKDSHFTTPIIKEKFHVLLKKDFYPFKETIALFAMTAHVIYQQIDPFNTVTHSRLMINEIIRKKLKFGGIIISDDISMKSLRYSLKENAIKSFDSGCNLILHCNAKLSETILLCKLAPEIDTFTTKKTHKFYNNLI